MQIQITINVFPEPEKVKPTKQYHQLELPLFKRQRGRPHCGLNCYDLRRVLNGIGAEKLCTSNIDEVCQKLGIKKRTVHRIWRDLKMHFEKNQNDVSN